MESTQNKRELVKGEYVSKIGKLIKVFFGEIYRWRWKKQYLINSYFSLCKSRNYHTDQENTRIWVLSFIKWTIPWLIEPLSKFHYAFCALGFYAGCCCWYFVPGSEHYPFCPQKDLHLTICTDHEVIKIGTELLSQKLENHCEHCDWDEVAGNSRHMWR